MCQPLCDQLGALSSRVPRSTGHLESIEGDVLTSVYSCVDWNDADHVHHQGTGILPRNVCMIAIMWQFDVKSGREAEFEQLYGVDGEWTALNRHTRSYLGTSFLHDQNRSSRYVVIEYWSEMLVYEQHREFRGAAVAAFEERSAALVAAVEPLGIFTALNVPDRTGPTWSRRR